MNNQNNQNNENNPEYEQDYDIQNSMLQYYNQLVANRELRNQQLRDQELKKQELRYQQTRVKINNVLNKNDKSINHKLFKKVYPKLNDYQEKIFCDCIQRQSAGLSLPLGSGKTILSLLLSLYNTYNTNQPVLIVMSKSLIYNWEDEIKKFFGDELKYEVIHKTRLKKPLNVWKRGASVILTTIDVLSKAYKEFQIDDKFIHQRFAGNFNYTNEYRTPTNPYLNHVIGGGLFYSTRWGVMIVDEVQKYTNIETLWCQSLGSLCVDHRWLLSGTMFNEPKAERILGYYIILNESGMPRELPEMKTLLRSPRYVGLNKSLVHRERNEKFVPPQVNELVITHKLSREEEKIYLAMKRILVEIKKKADRAKLYEDVEELKKFNSYKLAVITYLRQILICPLIPLTSIIISSLDMKKKNELSEIIMTEMNQLGLGDWMDDVNSAKSSRIKQVLKYTKKHPNEKIIIFSAFKSFLTLFNCYLEGGNNVRRVFTLTARMSITQRGDLIKEFEKSNNGILLLTYQLGAEGLNLQFASTMLIVDFWWNASKTKQAIGRIFRYGQVSNIINLYFFTANTGLENVLFQKQKSKLSILEELKTGAIKTKIKTMKLDEVIKLIAMGDNKALVKDIDYY
jgi:SNF2 family DNA or RNA helicase